MIPTFSEEFVQKTQLTSNWKHLAPIRSHRRHLWLYVCLLQIWHHLQGTISWLFKIFLIHCILHIFFGLGITGGAHRLWSHKSYTASKALKIFLMLCNCGTNQGSIFHWSRDHRLHHKFSDSPLDPHNINQGFFFSHVGWLLVKKTPELVEEGKKIDMSDLKKD